LGIIVCIAYHDAIRGDSIELIQKSKHHRFGALCLE